MCTKQVTELHKAMKFSRAINRVSMNKYRMFRSMYPAPSSGIRVFYLHIKLALGTPEPILDDGSSRTDENSFHTEKDNRKFHYMQEEATCILYVNNSYLRY
jgi:hypothetical protein